ncbi:MAG: GxxExxY protein [bacterium]|nr:GxxExxY protein [bacterium]
MLFKDLSYKIISAAIEVHNTLGPGFLESAYQKAMELELKSRDIPFESQRELRLFYKETEISSYVVDILLADSIILELKAVSELADIHRAQLTNYLKAGCYQLGILINFGEISLKYERIAISRKLGFEKERFFVKFAKFA